MSFSHRVMLHEVDPKEKIWNKIGSLDTITITYSWILVGVYERPEKTKSGIHLPDTGSRDEDKYQGKIGLVLKVGPLAFKDTESVQFNGFKVEEGEWIVLAPSDGWSLSVHGQICRMVTDAAIKMVASHPDEVW
jgi:co-chaperonin GroES (HSP10)